MANLFVHDDQAATNRPPLPGKSLAMTSAARVTTARTVGMPLSTGFAAIVVRLFFNGLASVNNTQARVTGTFHLSNGSHGSLLNGLEWYKRLNICSGITITLECLFRYQDYPIFSFA
jgi:hypothetical protein